MKWLLRSLKILGLTVLGLVLTFALAITLFFSQPKLHLWLFSQLDNWTDGLVSVERSEGHIFESIQLYNVAVRHPALELDIDHLDWRLDLFKLWYGRLTFEHIHLGRLDLTLLPQPDSEPVPPNPEPFAPLLAIPLLIELDSLRASQIHIHQGEQQHLIEGLDTALAWQLRRLVLKHLRLQYDGHQLALRGHTRIHDASHFSGQLALELDSATLPATALTTRWQGSLQALAIELDSEQPLQLRSQHQLQLPADGPLQLHSRWQQLHYPLSPEWALTSPAGELELTLAEQLQLDGQLDWQLGELPTIAQTLSLHFDLQDHLQLETQSTLPDGGQLQVTSDVLLAAQQLRASITGDLALDSLLPDPQLHYRGQMQLAVDGFEQPTVELDLHHTEITLPEYHARLDGRLWLKASELLGEAARPRLQLEADGLNLHQGEHHARIDGPLQLQLLDPDSQRIQLHTETLQIAWLGRLARLQLDLQADPSPNIEIKQLQLALGDNRLQLSGRYGEQAQLQLNAELNRLDQLLPELAGRLRLDAQLRGPLEAIQARYWLQGEGLGYQQWQLALLHLNGETPLEQPWQGPLELSLTDLRSQQTTLLQQLQLRRQHSAGQMHTTLELTHPEAQLQLALQDRHQGLDQLDLQLVQLTLDSPYTGPWQLDKPTRLQWLGGHQLRSTPLCLLAEQGEDARLCLRADAEAIHWNWQALPLFDWLTPLLPEGIELAGLLHGDGQLQLGENPGQDWQLQQRLGITRIDLLAEQLGYRLPLAVDDWTLQLQADAAQARIDSSALLNRSGRFELQLALDNHHDDWQQAALAGRLRAELDALELPEDLLSLIELKQHRIALHSRLSGTLTAPQHDSGAELELLVDLPILGLHEQHLRLDARLDSDSILAEGSLSQPQQRALQFNARVDGLAAGQTDALLHLQSDDIQLIDSPFASLRSTANIQLKLHDNELHIGGNTHLHHSRIDLQRIPLQERTKTSRDEVIIDLEGQPVLVDQDGPAVFLNLAVSFGEEVQILLRDVEAWLGGGLALRQSPGEDMRGTGQVSLDRGHIQLDPRNRIQIDRSTFTFTGLLGNPTLDVLLSRRVEHIQTYLNVTGTATSPQFVFYSTPSLSQGNIINLMIFGRAVDVDREPNYESQLLSALYKLGLSGNTPVLSQITTSLGIHDVYFDIQDEQSSNLILGRALTDRLYIRYAMGLSDRQTNAVQMFYQLSRRWVLETLSGDDQQSVDIIWTHER